MTIKGETFRLLQYFPSTDIYVYERTYGKKNIGIHKCIEVIRPVYVKQDGQRIPTYPCSEQFGSYGYCCNINDYWLKEKIAFWGENGLQHFVPPKDRTVKPHRSLTIPTF